jgi:hypothetical protein
MPPPGRYAMGHRWPCVWRVASAGRERGRGARTARRATVKRVGSNQSGVWWFAGRRAPGAGRRGGDQATDLGRRGDDVPAAPLRYAAMTERTIASSRSMASPSTMPDASS